MMRIQYNNARHMLTLTPWNLRESLPKSIAQNDHVCVVAESPYSRITVTQVMVETQAAMGCRNMSVLSRKLFGMKSSGYF